MVQLAGVVGVGIFTFAVSMIGWSLIKVAMGIRVSAEEEYAGLDLGEHGISAYPEFHTSSGVAGPAVSMGRSASMMSTEAVAGRG
jgi:Amt family ammonium transporter